MAEKGLALASSYSFSSLSCLALLMELLLLFAILAARFAIFAKCWICFRFMLNFIATWPTDSMSVVNTPTTVAQRSKATKKEARVKPNRKI